MTTYAEDKIEELTTEVNELRTAYDNLNREYSSLMNRHTDLQSQYDDCAGRIGIDADKLAQTEQMLEVAHYDVNYLKTSLAHAKSQVEIWQARAEGCAAEKDELLTLIEDIRSKGLKTAKDYKQDEDFETLSIAAAGLMQVVDTFMKTIKPGMTEKDVAMMQMTAMSALMPVMAKLPN